MSLRLLRFAFLFLPRLHKRALNNRCLPFPDFRFFVVRQAQRGSQRFLEPEIDYSPWNPIPAGFHPVEVKTNRARSIQSSAPEPVLVPKTTSLRKRVRVSDEAKAARQRNFPQETLEVMSAEKTSTQKTNFKRRPSRSTTAATREKVEDVTNRFKVTRKPASETLPTTTKPRRQFTARSTSENVLVTTSEAPSPTKAALKRVPFTRGNFRPKTTEKPVDGNAGAEEANYPEHFKLLLKNKEADGEADKTVQKKPLKSFRASSVNKTTKSPAKPAPKSNVLLPTRAKTYSRVTSSTTTTDQPPSPTEAARDAPVTMLRSRFRRPKPTERTKTTFGSTIQEPPTARSTSSYATRSPMRHSRAEDAPVVNTQADTAKQIDPPLREYFPRTSAVSRSKAKVRLRDRLTMRFACRSVHP